MKIARGMDIIVRSEVGLVSRDFLISEDRPLNPLAEI